MLQSCGPEELGLTPLLYTPMNKMYILHCVSWCSSCNVCLWGDTTGTIQPNRRACPGGTSAHQTPTRLL